MSTKYDELKVRSVALTETIRSLRSSMGSANEAQSVPRTATRRGLGRGGFSHYSLHAQLSIGALGNLQEILQVEVDNLEAELGEVEAKLEAVETLLS